MMLPFTSVGWIDKDAFKGEKKEKPRSFTSRLFLVLNLEEVTCILADINVSPSLHGYSC